MRQQPAISRAAMQELDRAAQTDFGVPGAVLMENAGREVANVVLQRLRAYKVSRAVAEGMSAAPDSPDVPRNLEELDVWKAGLKQVDGPVAVICGPGNNGGDGAVVARTLINQGVMVYTIAVGFQPSETSGDAAGAWRAFTALQESIIELHDEAALPGVLDRLRDCELVVDALFGTGLSRPLDGVYRRVVEEVNRLDLPMVAVDLPSGLCADTGQMLGATILADLTLTFGVAKRGMLRGHGPDCCGTIEVAEIGFPRSLLERAIAASQT